ncbi:MAG: tyrosine--tRNA ligase [Planctomycetota bacterium]|jgi:tyrosyl-tRNA synthetase
MNVFDEFSWRGQVHDSTEGAKALLGKEDVTVYCGFDPSASSLHIGSMVPIMGLARLQRFGHHVIAIAGGGTGLIGDPSGKTAERQLLSEEQVQANVEGIKQQLSHFLDFDSKANPARLINNADWLRPISLLDFLRDVGKHFTVNAMLAKESVKRRIESEDGISYTEFTYMLFQAYDFVVLHDKYKCNMQVGGSDQWGNIVTGIDLLRRMRGIQAYGMVFPLITTATGAKFGKTEAGAVWLDPAMTSPFKFYQYWLNTDDRDVIRYLKTFTWLGEDDIGACRSLLESAPEKREAQRKLAEEVTTMLHGPTECDKARRASRVLFGEEIKDLSSQDILDIFEDVPSSSVSGDSLTDGISLLDLAKDSAVVSSKGEGRRLIQSGGLYVNNRRISEMDYVVTRADVVSGEFVVLRKGQKKYHLVRVV